MTDLRLTIGMAVVNDFRGMRYTLSDLQISHGHMLPYLEFVVVHNDPESRDGEKCRRWVEQKVWNAKFVPFPTPKGTSAPRDAIFQHATAPTVAVIDPHVIFGQRGIQNLVNFFNANPKCRDLIHGPLMQDRPILRPLASHPMPRILATHMRPVWRDSMLGIWAKAWKCQHCGTLVDVSREQDEGLVFRSMAGDPVERCHCGRLYPTVAFSGHEGVLEQEGLRELNQGDPPFRIPAHGLGFFACRRDAWLGFPEHLRGFGGEEVCLHQLFEQEGRSTWCLPAVPWTHEFRDPDDDPGYPNLLNDRLHNYLVWRRRLRQSPVDAIEHFNARLSPAQLVAVVQGVNKLFAGQPLEARPVENLADAAYRQACRTPSDINEHLPTLKALAAECETVVELGVRSGVSTRALIVGRPKVLRSVDINPAPDLSPLAEAAGVDWCFEQGSSLEVEPVPCDMLFIDTLHTAAQLRAELDRHAAQVRRYIVLHDTETFGIQGEGGGEGLLKALGEFLSANAAEWELREHFKNNNGLTVLRRWNVETDPSRGLGDTIAKMTHATGLDRLTKSVARWFGADCGCTGRQAVLNQWFSFGGKT